MSFLKEILHPRLRCQRTGHDYFEDVSYWFADTRRAKELLGDKYWCFRSVAEKLKKTETRCRRCGEVLKTEWKQMRSYSGFTYSGHEFEETGLIRAE